MTRSRRPRGERVRYLCHEVTGTACGNVKAIERTTDAQTVTCNMCRRSPFFLSQTRRPDAFAPLAYPATQRSLARLVAAGFARLR